MGSAAHVGRSMSASCGFGGVLFVAAVPSFGSLMWDTGGLGLLAHAPMEEQYAAAHRSSDVQTLLEQYLPTAVQTQG